MSMKGRQTMDHEKVSFNLARLKKGGKTFEFAVDADLAIDFRNGKDIPISEIVKSEKIFSDVKKGEIAVESDLSELFGSHDFAKIAPVILKEGAIQLTAEHRALLRDVKRKKRNYRRFRTCLQVALYISPPTPHSNLQSKPNRAFCR